MEEIQGSEVEDLLKCDNICLGTCDDSRSLYTIRLRKLRRSLGTRPVLIYRTVENGLPISLSKPKVLEIERGYSHVWRTGLQASSA